MRPDRCNYCGAEYRHQPNMSGDNGMCMSCWILERRLTERPMKKTLDVVNWGRIEFEA